MQRHHDMPFGAQLLPQGRTRFRFWAPQVREVNLLLTDETGKTLNSFAMQVLADGWFELTTEAGAGMLYCFGIDDGDPVPDPASRFQPQDIHGPSEVIDPCAWQWQDSHWRGRPWEEAVIYELHTGCFSPEGDFAGIQNKLDDLVDLGITAIELMPVADFPGARNWGYDGVLPFAPDSRYGRPEALKALVDAAHARGLMVLLDVVYNHFGPEGNHLHRYAPQFFTERHHTPWGAAINYDSEGCYWVRQFFIHNALYWLEEFHLDGLRLDAVHAIMDESEPHILTELAQRVHQHFGAFSGTGRQIHLVLENDDNTARYLDDGSAANGGYRAQWNDDLHHVLHLLLTDEQNGYYCDYAQAPIERLGRCLTEGFAYQGDVSAYRQGRRRGEPSAHLPPTAFVAFLQNHDQIGNRAFGEYLTHSTSMEKLRAATVLMLLAPSPPLLFMGQEWGCEQRFLFFCDFGPELAAKVAEGRRNEFAAFPEFSDPSTRERIPDPGAAETFLQSVLDWSARAQPQAQQWLALHRDLLRLRQRRIQPRLRGMAGKAKIHLVLGERALCAKWVLGDGSELILFANLGDEPCLKITPPTQQLLYATHDAKVEHSAQRLPPWSVFWYLE